MQTLSDISVQNTAQVQLQQGAETATADNLPKTVYICVPSSTKAVNMMTKTFDAKCSKPRAFQLEEYSFARKTQPCIDPTDYYSHMRMQVAPDIRCLYVVAFPTSDMSSTEYGTSVQRFEWDKQGALIEHSEKPLRDCDI